MIVLVTDFGLEGPYTGQVLRVLHEQAPGVPIVNLFADAPVWNPKATAYLINAYTQGFARGTIFLCVVDPAVGSGVHYPVVTGCEGRWFVGPDNGLFEIIRRRAPQAETWRIEWKPENISATFHGRDLYAPAAARLALGNHEGLFTHEAFRCQEWPDELAEIIYIDRYGNGMTGLRAAKMPANAVLECAGHRFHAARTFAAVEPGASFWYENANGLLEIATNQGHAADGFGLVVGMPLIILPKA